jgi:hypothetical protein
MKGMKAPWLLLAGLLVIVGLPLAGAWQRRNAAPRCDLNGLNIEPLYQVRVVDWEGASHRLCCVHCAQVWLKRQSDCPRAVFVTDEASGAEIDAQEACFVQSTVLTNPITRNRIHVFRDRAMAESHAHAFSGWLLTDAERPFSVVASATPGPTAPGR